MVKTVEALQHKALGPCECGRIHFTCPRCERTHDRGYVNGVDVFRCLGCGYVGHGFHPDEDVDAKIGAEMKENIAFDRSRGLMPPAFWEGP